MTHGMPEPEPRPRRSVMGALVTALVSLVVILLIVWAFGLLADDEAAPEPEPRGVAVLHAALRVDAPRGAA